MIIEHLGIKPSIHPDAFVAPTATICGDVVIGAGARVLFGASVIAEGGRIEIGENCIVLENAVVRSTARHSTSIGRASLIGPNAHVVGCTIDASVFIATGAAVFHGAHLETGCEVRINGVVHTKSRVPAGATVPIGWVAVGNPAEILPPEAHDRIWSIQEPLDFPSTVYGVERSCEGRLMSEITSCLSRLYATHTDDKILQEWWDPCKPD